MRVITASHTTTLVSNRLREAKSSDQGPVRKLNTGAETGVGSLWGRWSCRSTDRHRWVTVLGVAGAAGAVLMAIAGLPPVDLHGVLHYLGVMDPLCGATRAARLAAEGRWSAAWQYNPLGIAADVGAVLAVLRAAVGYLSGRWLDVAITWTPGRRRAVLAIGLTLLVAPGDPPAAPGRPACPEELKTSTGARVHASATSGRPRHIDGSRALASTKLPSRCWRGHGEETTQEHGG